VSDLRKWIAKPWSNCLRGKTSLSKLISSSIRYKKAFGALLKRPDAWQSATKQVVDFEANLESYLRNTNKEELRSDQARSAITAQ